MTLDEALAVLKEGQYHEGELFMGTGEYVLWRRGERTACLDGWFTWLELEAIATVMKQNEI